MSTADKTAGLDVRRLNELIDQIKDEIMRTYGIDNQRLTIDNPLRPGADMRSDTQR